MNEALDRPAPLVAGQRITVTISDIAFGGEGVARVESCVVFVPLVLVGEEVEAEITEVKKQFARARLLKVRRASPERVTPPCPHFGVCGGCQYQHVDYAAQLRLKERQIRELLQRLGGINGDVVQPMIPCPQPYGYRNRLLIRSQWNKREQRLVIGFLGQDNRFVVDLEACAIAEPALNQEIRQVRAHPPPRGGLKVQLRIQPEGWVVPRDSFFQNNFFLLPGLVATVRERLQDSGVRHLVDAYCGVGFFSLELAGLVESFVGVEYDRLAVAAARQNAQERGVANGEFVAGDAVALLPELLARFRPERTAVVLDPPRVGCRPEAITQLRAALPAQILYVSCHPATLARDLQALCAGGAYRVARVTPLDMFPQTQHVECVADLRREPAAAAPVPGTANELAN